MLKLFNLTKLDATQSLVTLNCAANIEAVFFMFAPCINIIKNTFYYSN
jgi:hypothetical protein